MGSINRKTLVRESAAHENHGTGGASTVTLLQLDLSSYQGYNYGNTGNAAVASLNLKSAGVRGSGFNRQNGEWVIQLRRQNAAAPVVTTFADANNFESGIYFDISGNIFRARLSVIGSNGNPTITLAELFGVIIDYTTP